jgi:hypothetical protein
MQKIGTLHNNFFFEKDLSQKFHLIFHVKILIDLKQNQQIRLTIKFNANVKIVPRQPFSTHQHFVHGLSEFLPVVTSLPA